MTVYTHNPQPHFAGPSLAPAVWLLSLLLREIYVFHGSDLFLINKPNIFPLIILQLDLFIWITNIYSPLLVNLRARVMMCISNCGCAHLLSMWAWPSYINVLCLSVCGGFKLRVITIIITTDIYSMLIISRPWAKPYTH